MREVEIKAAITESNILVNKLLLEGAKFVKKIVQNDDIYIHKDKDFLKLGSGDKIFRIRNIGTDFEFNLKIPMANELDCLEYELKIDNANEMEKILYNLDFIKAICVAKTREIYRLGELTLNIDVVDGLGKFVELEKIVSGDDVSEYQIELKKILLSFYNLPVEFLDFGYDTLLYRKNIVNR